MNKVLLSLCLVLLGLMAWREKATLLEWKDKAVARLEKLVSGDHKNSEDATATKSPDADNPPPSPGIAPAPSPATTPAPVPAKLPDPPEGVYYLRERISVKTDAGVRGYNAGTRVTKTGENLGLLVVTDGSSSFSVESDQLTRDMNLVIEIQSKAAAAAVRAPAPRPSVPVQAPPANATPGSSTAPVKTAIDSERRRLLAQVEAIDRQIAAVDTQIQDANSRQNLARARGRSSSAAAAVPELQRTRKALDERRANLVSQLTSLPP